MWLEAHYLMLGLPSTLEPWSRARARELLLNPKVASVTFHKIGARLRRPCGEQVVTYELTPEGWRSITKRGARAPLGPFDLRALGILPERGSHATPT